VYPTFLERKIINKVFNINGNTLILIVQTISLLAFILVPGNMSGGHKTVAVSLPLK
jgi:hypothetical protein